jgi:hypothetical protein
MKEGFSMLKEEGDMEEVERCLDPTPTIDCGHGALQGKALCQGLIPVRMQLMTSLARITSLPTIVRENMREGDCYGCPLKKKGKIVTITLNRPERVNRTDAEICQALSSALIGFKDDPEAWVAIITGAGDAFSTGADHDKLLRLWADQ